jgi:hypothetical protein
MKRRQKFITTLSLIGALSGLSPVMAADAGMNTGNERINTNNQRIERPLSYKLSPEQMDKTHAGWASYAYYVLGHRPPTYGTPAPCTLVCTNGDGSCTVHCH